MSEDERLRSQLRLFLSVDLSGSTRLKAEKNYSTLDPTNIAQHNQLAKENFDWAEIQMRLFRDFHADFISRVENLNLPHFEKNPWKALGDELVYSIEIKNHEQVCMLCGAFLQALRFSDKKSTTVRLTGTAWVAGFPLRNRVVSLPMAQADIGKGESPYPGRDYWGPDLDIGFRLGKHSYPGMCVASMSLVELCGQYENRSPVRFRHVGWEKLKGVFDGNPYPVFWMDLPQGIAEPVEPHILPWAVGDSSHMKEWCKEEVHDAHGFIELCEGIRKSLPQKLMVARPYIPANGVPKEDKELIDYIRALPEGVEGTQEVETAENQDEGVKLNELLKLIESYSKPQ